MRMLLCILYLVDTMFIYVSKNVLRALSQRAAMMQKLIWREHKRWQQISAIIKNVAKYRLA